MRPHRKRQPNPLRIRRYLVTRATECECEWCGYPMYVGESAHYSAALDAVVCCRDHARRLASITENPQTD